MTRIVILEKTGEPEVLKFETINLDKPGSNEVLIEHKAIGLNYIDTYHRSGMYPLQLPSGIGGEGSGIIKAIGSKVKDFSVGDSVAYAGTPLGSYSTLSPTEKSLTFDPIALIMPEPSPPIPDGN
jgi:NADPH2:quinone reductase